jgi:hypothetical protein
MGSPVGTGAAQAFFSGLIDYAGLFPPAALSVRESVLNFREYLDRPERWILARFIATAAQLEQIGDDLLEKFTKDLPLEVSLVTRDPRKDLPAAHQTLGASSGRIVISAIEFAINTKSDIAQQLSTIESLVPSLEVSGAKIPVFYEVPLCDDWPMVFSRLCDQIVASQATTSRTIGFKLRCGGVEKDMIPSPERVARAIHACAAKRIPIKFTAGLHQPFRHIDPLDPRTGDVPLHGYCNIFFAALVANATQAALPEIISIVSEMHSLRPEFDLNGIRWLGHEVSTQQIAAARSAVVISYGSCSFEEPLQAARDLGWL